MTVTEKDLQQLRTEMTERLTTVSLDVMGALTALSDHADRFNRLEGRFDRVDTRIDTLERKFDDAFARHDARFDALDKKFDGKFDALDQKFLAIDGKFDALDRKFDGKFERLETKLDGRFGWQAAMTAALGVMVLFADPLRELIGL